MELTKKLSDAFNAQIQAEMWSSNLYLSMAVHFMDQGLDGCAHWMKKQAAEELEHAHKLIDYAVQRGGKVQVSAIDAVPTEWASPLAVFEHVYKHEKHVSELIDKLMDLAVAEGDKATQDFLWWFVREQVEEEDSAKKIVDKFNIFGVHGLVCIDKELGKR
ncbi:MAG: ferritin [Rikenellaceae bacterium]|nr:ferritin [Rikenellaceae bacterium]